MEGLERSGDEAPPLMELRRLKALSLLGRGAKGVAFLVKDDEESSSSEQGLLALKVISKAALIEKKRKNNDSSSKRDNDPMKRIWFERDVLNLLDHPLLPKLRGVVVTGEIVCFAMDYCPGGNLNTLRKQQTEKMFSEDLIRFYAAEIVLALEYLHGLGIVYRDLKPENILIQENGHLMVVDFDLSTKSLISPSKQSRIKQQSLNNNSNMNMKKKKKKNYKILFSCLNLHKAGVSPVDSSAESRTGIGVDELPKKPVSERSNSFVGTEEYVSPEIISGTGHDSAVDRWGLGVVMYEMLYGRTPFRGTNRSETFYRILTKEPELVGDPTALRDLIRKLLEKDPAMRISMEEIKGHEFFKGLDWDSVVRISRPPYIPPPQMWEEEDVEGIKEIDVEEYVKEAWEGQNGNCDDRIGGKSDHKKETQTQSYKKDVWREGLGNPIKTSDFSVF